MTDDEKKRWLWRYRDALRRERELKEELQEQKTRAASVTAALTGMPGAASDGQTLPRAVESIVAAQAELQAQINVCGAVRRKVVAAIDQVQDERDHTILYRRYVLGQTYEQIAEKLDISVRYCIKLHVEAIKRLSPF